MRLAFLEREEGQALVIVGLAMMALLGAVALAVDWGFGYATRREMQNDADSAALTAGRRVVSTFEARSSPSFEATQEEVCKEVALATRTPSATVEIALFSDANVRDPASWAKISTANCGAGAGLPIPPDTVFVRARATVMYPSLFNVVTRGPMTVGASARVRLTSGAVIRPLLLPAAAGPRARNVGDGLSGSTTEPNAPIWPIMLRFNASTFTSDACGRFCDEPGREIELWANGAPQMGAVLVTFAHQSTRQPNVHQLITESDFTGAAAPEDGRPWTGLRTNTSTTSSCSNGSWDTKGGADARTCDLPNWFHYGFRGSVSLGTDWGRDPWRAYANDQRPSALSTARSSCAAAQPYVPTRSCDKRRSTSRLGDWVETADGVPDMNMALRMHEFIRQYGRDTVASVTRVLGKALVVNVFLWDCAERFSDGNWTLQGTSVSCSQFSVDPSASSDFRVHAFTVVPLTFYEGLIDESRMTIKAFWGDAFGDAGDCQRSQNWSSSACALNPLMNSAFLVPDE